MQKKVLLCLTIFTLSLTVLGCSVNDDTSDSLDSENESSYSSSISTSIEEEEEERMDIEEVNSLYSLFDYIGDWNNYSLTIEYYEIFSSNYYSSIDEAKAARQNNEMSISYLDYLVNIIHTEDAILYEYYYDKENYENGTIDDIELFVNDYDSNRVNVYYFNDDRTGLYLAGNYQKGGWEDIFYDYNVAYLSHYKTGILKGETSEGDKGRETEYTFNMSFSGLGEELVKTLFNSYNMFCVGEMAFSPVNVAYLFTNTGYDSYYTYTSTYFEDILEWENTVKTSGIYWTGKPTSTSTESVSWYEQDEMSSYLYDVSNSTIPDIYQQYL